MAAIVLPGCGGSPDQGGGTSTPSPDGTTAAAPENNLVLTPVTPPPAPPPPPPPPARPPQPRARRTQAPPPPPPVPGVPVAPSPAVPGTYSFAETGLTRIRGCVTLDQPPPAVTRLTVAAPAGNIQRFDRDQRDLLGSGGTTVLDAEYRPEGIYMTYLRQTQTSLLSSQPTEFRPGPPALLLPAGATAGQAWSINLVSVDGQVRIDSQNRIEVVDEKVTLRNGQTVVTRKVLADARITGQSSQGTLDLVRKQTTWYEPGSGLPVKEAVEMTGRVGLCNIESRTEATLQSL